MKYFILVPDGAAGYPVKELGGKTSLEAAEIPTLDMLAQKSITGTVKTIPQGFEPGSDVANLSILGFDPNKYYPGRGPLEAAYHNIKVAVGQTIFRCNLVTVKDGVLIDYSAGHIKTTQSAKIMGYLDQIIPHIEFFPGVSYRNLAAVDGNFEDMKFFAPHDVLGKSLDEIYPKGDKRDFFIELYEESKQLLDEYSVNIKREAQGMNKANMIWLWGGGKDIKIPSFKDKYNKTGAMISAVDLLKGIARKAGLEVVEVDGATGYLDTNYAGKIDAAYNASRRHDVVFVHIEAPDEAGHGGKAELKIKALDDFDKKVVKALMDKLGDEHYKILILPDHYTPLELRTHTCDPVPFIVFDSEKPHKSTAKSFTEFQLSKSEKKIENGFDLLEDVLFN